MGLSVYLGSDAVPGPGNLDGYEQTIVRDFDRRMIYIEAPGTLTFTGGAYRILRDAFIADFCSAMPVRIYDDCSGIAQLIVSGEVILADIKWNLSRCTADAPIQIGSVGARILDGMKIVLTPTSNRSRRGDAITPCASIFVTVFDPQNPATTIPRLAYDWKEAIRHAVDFLSDGTVIVNNDWYDSLPDDERIALVQGVVWRDDTSQIDPLSWSLDSLWLEVAKRFNVWMVARLSPAGVNSISIVSGADVFGTTSGRQIAFIDGISQSVDGDAVYSSMKVGEDRDKNRTGSSYSALPYLRGLTHTSETYGAECPCATSNELDLSGEWVADHGLLENTMWRDTANKEIDEKVCMIQYTASTNAATASEYTFGAPLYNESMLNYNVLTRYAQLCSIILASDPSPGVLALNNSPLSPDQAFQTGAALSWYEEGQYQIGPFDANPPSFNSLGIYDRWPLDTPPFGTDVGNQWSVNEYTSLTTGYKRISWRFGGSVMALSPSLMPASSNMWRTRITIRHYSALNALLQTLEFSSQPIANGAEYTYLGSAAIFMNAGEFFLINAIHEAVRVNGDATPLPVMYLLAASAPRFVEVTSFSLPIVPGSERVVIVSSFDRHVSSGDWSYMMQYPDRSIVIDGAGLGPTTAWIKKATRDIMRGKTKLELMHALT